MSKTIFITGASSGLGKAAAKFFQEKGWNVAATMRKPENEEELSRLENVKLYKLDVTNLEHVEESSRQAIEDFGKIDVVLNNAGYGLAGVLESLSDDQITRQLNTNLLGVIRVTKSFLKHFRENKDGLFINVTSIGGLTTFPMFSLYHSTKWALEGFSESLWFEMKQIGVGVKTVSPGGITTDFAGRSLDMADASSLKVYDELIAGMMEMFDDPERQKKYSSAEQIAEVIYEAATDGKDNLRYVAGEDAKEMYGLRNELGDQKYMEAMLNG